MGTKTACNIQIGGRSRAVRKHHQKEGRHASYGGGIHILTVLMVYIVACPAPELLEALCAFADHLATLLAALAESANSMVAVATFTYDHQTWFRLWLSLGTTTPSRGTYLRLVGLLDGTSLPGLRELVLALDGKVARRSGDRAAGRRALHLVSAFLVREGLTLAQEPCAAKSNEIAALPRLLARLVLEGSVATIGAAGCQRAIVQALQAAGADYVLALKRNQRTFHRAVKEAFDEAARGAFRPQVEHNGGHRERRRCTVLGGPGLCEGVADPEAWPGLRSLVRVQTERTSPRGRRQRAVRYYISSQPPDATALRSLVRGHWGVENDLHRTLDVQFREDDGCIRTGHARSRHHGHPAPGCPEHGTHGSTESQFICVHWPAARPHRTPALAPGLQPALNPTLRLPWIVVAFIAYFADKTFP